MRTHVIPLACPSCRAELGPEVDSVAFSCAGCAKSWRVGLRGLESQPVHWATAEDGKPWWRLPGTVQVSDRRTFGSSAGPDERWQEVVALWIPAWDRDLKQVRSLAEDLTFAPPALAQLAPSDGATHPPCVLSGDDALAVARVMIVQVEAKRHDDLKSLDIELDVGPAELWILP